MEKVSPLQTKYIQSLSSVLRFTGAWPFEIFGQKLPLPILIHRVTLPYHTMIIVFGGLYYLYENYNRLNFLDMGHMIITTFLATITILRSYLPNTDRYKSMLRQFIYEFHLMHYTHRGEYYEEMNEKVNKISYYYTKCIAIIMYVGMAMFNISPAYNNLRNTVFSKTENYSMEYSVYMSFPGFKPLDYFATTTIYNCYLSFNCGTLFCGLDLLIFLMCFQIIGHVLILRHDLENLPRPLKLVNFIMWNTCTKKSSCTFDIFTASENDKIRKKLAKCVEHHKTIIKFTDDLSTLFGPMLALNYLFHMIACCLLLLECTKGGTVALLRYGSLTMSVFGQLIQMSLMFEMLGAVTEKLNNSIYYTPWECMDVSNQRTVCIILHRMQDKISLKAMGLAAVGVNTMTAILKTTFSYYAFLLSIGEGET